MFLKNIFKSLLPSSVLASIRSSRIRKAEKDYRNLTTQQIFSKIYEEGVWGASGDPKQKFFSGLGSHQGEIVKAYLTAVQQFLSSLPKKPDVVDLGCGDFHVGANIREQCGSYIACDIVPSLIEFNREKYKSLDVDFRVLDLANENLPNADVVFIRQVLQHLSNRNIRNVIPKLERSYKFLVLTEHLPELATFTPNLDRPSGPGIRMDLKSGIVLTQSPFNLKTQSEQILCEIPEGGPHGGVIRTTLYRLS